MATLTNGCEGTNGTTASLANSDVSGDAWTLTASVANATCTYATLAAVHGDTGMAVATGATAGAERRGWSVNAGNLSTTQHFRFYIDPTSAVGTVAPLRGMNLTSSGQRFRIQVSAGVVTLHNNANAVAWTSTALTAGVWRIETSIDGLTSATGRVHIYRLDSTVTAQDSGAITGNWGGPIREVWFGQTASAVNVALRLDDCGWSDTALLGPARPVVPASSAAGVTGRTPAGTVTARRTSTTTAAGRTSSATVTARRTSTPEVS